MTDTERQEEEVEVLMNIVEDGMFSADIMQNAVTKEREYWLKFVFNNITFVVILPSDYPSRSPPRLVPSSKHLKYLNESDFDAIDMELRARHQSAQDVIMFDWYQWTQEYLENHQKLQTPTPTDNQPRTITPPPVSEPDRHIEIHRGPELLDRKSKFVCFVAKCQTQSDVDWFYEELHTDKKVAKATHNVLAYRLVDPKIESYNDDGEDGAGGTLLDLLQKLQLWDVAVCVSRWFGGILLYSDRFKDFQVVTRNALEEFGFLNQEQAQSGKKKGGKKR
ncbi:putative Protein IMPACT like protein [Blattamonas nauphoetae]|uniref:RWD domain-containing protein n=1 Tax=Blattamonas nauphoetae TaxID=2049346 RepID=A0ABQ9XRF2_9EUKA|nr:putative Protein IMPACT like protein [Blattamonas nauphoetae]